MHHNRKILQLALFGLIILGFSILALAGSRSLPAKTTKAKRTTTAHAYKGPYPYHSKQFTQFVSESFACSGSGCSSDFYKWMDKAYKDAHYPLTNNANLALNDALTIKRIELSRITNKAKRANAEVELGARTHRLIKKTIAHFSLDRGFEFCNVVKYGERQCFLQSVLIASLLQRMGVDAGVAMVYKNIQGQETNNGHAVTLVKLSNGQDIIVDASEQEPFARQRGLFSGASDYKYINPVYEKNSDRINYFTSASGGGKIDTAHLKPLDVTFLRSQFWFYRGERARGGLLASVKTRNGLAESAKALETSIRICPKNPLSVFVLGRVYRMQGNDGQARVLFERAYKLYKGFGWVPAGPKEYVALGRSVAHRPR